MRDLTRGWIAGHLTRMTGPTLIGLSVQILCNLVDLYFVARIGGHALAAVATAQFVFVVTVALSQTISVGALSLVSVAIGRGDGERAQDLFDQSLSMATVAGILTLLAGYPIARSLELMTDAVTAELAQSYLYASLPAIALIYPGAAVASALRAAGIVFMPTMIRLGVVGLNVALAPVLIAGWGTGRPLGVAGAGLATTTATLVGTIAFILLLKSDRSPFPLRPSAWRLDLKRWKEIAEIGGPAALDFLLAILLPLILYWRLQSFGTDVQAGAGLGSRLQQALLIPAAAVAFSATPVFGQNIGAGHSRRALEALRVAMIASAALTISFAMLCYSQPMLLIAPFATEPAVTAAAAEYLVVTCWSIVAFGFTLTAISMFQALGNTKPPLFSSAVRLLAFAVPALWLTPLWLPTFTGLLQLSVIAAVIEMSLCLLLLRVEIRRKHSMGAREMGSAAAQR